MDDLCALAMILKWPNLEITGVTTVSDDQGRRAGYVHYVLSLLGRTDIPCAAGADVSGGYYRYELGYPPEEENWPELITPRPGSPDKAVSLLKQSIEQGAVIVAAGSYTNLMLLQKKYPSIQSYSCSYTDIIWRVVISLRMHARWFVVHYALFPHGHILEG